MNNQVLLNPLHNNNNNNNVKHEEMDLLLKIIIKIISSFNQSIRKSDPSTRPKQNMHSIPIEVKIHPTVLFSVVDSYERRNEKMTRVVGTLLGTNIQGNIEVTDCFVVPHRDADEVAIDVEFAKNSFNAYKKISPSISIVGW